MADPLTLVVLGGAAGGAASELVKKGVECGQLWLREYFASHQAKVTERAAANTSDFLNRLAEKVCKLEEEKSIDRAVVDSVLQDPSYSLLLQKSILSAAESSSGTKHDLLSRIVSERIRHQEEDFFSLCAPLAIEAIARCTKDHLKMLSLLAYMFNLSHKAGLPEPVRAKAFFDAVSPLVDIEVTELDVLHLESISCLSYSGIVTYAPHQFVDKKFGGDEKVWDALPKYGDINPFLKVWNSMLLHCFPTSVGQLIGFTAFDQIRGHRTDLAAWGKK